MSQPEILDEMFALMAEKLGPNECQDCGAPLYIGRGLMTRISYLNGELKVEHTCGVCLDEKLFMEGEEL